MMRFVSVVLASVLLAGCATTSAGGGQRSSRDVLTEEEIQSARASGGSAYDLISQLRPEYLRSRGSISMQQVQDPPTAVVYVDNVRYGDLSSLRAISVVQIRQVRYLGANDATMRFGTNHSGGAILIETK